MKEYQEKKNYELSFLVANKGDEAAVGSLIRKHGAEVTTQGPVSEIRLSYPIKKHRIAHFGFLYFSSFPEEVERITHDLKFNPVVLRILVITPPIVKSEGRRMRKEENERTIFEKPEKEISQPVLRGGMLTNKDLEEKLEEILK